MSYLNSKLGVVVLGISFGLTPGTLTSAASQNLSSHEAIEGARAAVGEARAVPALQAYGRLPLQFQPHDGQTDPPVKFLARDRGYALFLTPAEAVLVLHRGVFSGTPSLLESRLAPGSLRSAPAKPAQEPETAVVRMQFVGADPATKMVGLDELPGKVNYFRGADPARWRSNVPTYARVAYRQLYPGIDLVFYGNQKQLEYDLVVAPGADPGAVALQLDGVETVSVNAQGDLMLKLAGGEIRWRKPVIYQEVDGLREPVAGRYVLKGLKRVGFHVATYDTSRPLVIDPVLAYSTYLGGSTREYAGGIAVDAAGNAYVTGTTRSADFPTANSLQGPSPEVWDVFVAKLDAAGSALVYSTFLGGSHIEFGLGIAVDAAGNAYVTGSTQSADFPTLNPIQACGRGADVFVTKLDAAASALVYSTCLGGSDQDWPGGIALDAAGNAYVTGATSSGDFPTVNPVQMATPVPESNCWLDKDGVQHCRRLPDAFVSKLNGAGSALVYSTYLGGSGTDVGSSVAVDSEGNAYVTGLTASPDFPTVNAIQASGAGSGQFDAFVTKLNAAGSALVYSTYLGGSGNEWQSAIAVDSAGNAYVTGQTQSHDFPTANALQATFGGGDSDAFVTKVNAAGSELVYSTYLGGSDFDGGVGIAVDPAGNAYVTGLTGSADFPTADALQANFLGAPDDCFTRSDTSVQCGTLSDAFVTKLNATGSALVYSTYLGGGGYDSGRGIAVDNAGNAYVVGETSSKDFPTVNPIQGARAGGLQGDGVSQDVDAFVTKILSNATD